MEADFLDKYEIQFLLQILHPPPPRNPNKKFLSVTVLCCSVFYTVEGANMRAGAVSGGPENCRAFLFPAFSSFCLFPQCVRYSIHC